MKLKIFFDQHTLRELIFKRLVHLHIVANLNVGYSGDQGNKMSTSRCCTYICSDLVTKYSKK